MKIPPTVKIGGHTYAVLRADLKDKAGETDQIARTITLETMLEGSSLESTLLHEAMHVMNSELDHALLDSLSEQIYQFLADNGLLNKELTNTV